MPNTFVVTKTYGHNLGLSVCFRQHGAESHCRFLHGYALGVRLRFKATELDSNGWVINYGGLSAIKNYLADNFDHKTLVAEDDPDMFAFEQAHELGVINLRVVERTGCEAFAKMVGEHVMTWLAHTAEYSGRVHLMSCEIMEHDGNSATFIPGA